MQYVAVLVWLAGGICSCVAALHPGPDRWRSLGFGVSLITYMLVDRLSAAVPAADLSNIGLLRLAALYVLGIGFMAAAPTMARGRFQPDRRLAQEFGIACFVWIVVVSLAYQFATPQGWWLLWLLPLTLWPLLLIPAWFRRLYQRGLRLELAAASLACVAACALGVASTVWELPHYTDGTGWEYSASQPHDN